MKKWVQFSSGLQVNVWYCQIYAVQKMFDVYNYCDMYITISACPDGWYGQDCIHQCNCVNGASCDRKTGRCICSNGWRGIRCAQSKHHHAIHFTQWYHGDGPGSHKVEGWKKCRPILGYISRQNDAVDHLPLLRQWNGCQMGYSLTAKSICL